MRLLRGRRDEWGWLTYPFWRTLGKLIPGSFWWHKWTRGIYVFFVANEYGEGERWYMRHGYPITRRRKP